LWMAREGSSCVPSWHPPCPPRLPRLHAGWRLCSAVRRRATEATELTEPTDRRRVMSRFSRTTVSLRHLAAARGLLLRVSGLPGRRLNAGGAEGAEFDEGRVHRPRLRGSGESVLDEPHVDSRVRGNCSSERPTPIAGLGGVLRRVLPRPCMLPAAVGRAPDHRRGADDRGRS